MFWTCLITARITLTVKVAGATDLTNESLKFVAILQSEALFFAFECNTLCGGVFILQNHFWRLVCRTPSHVVAWISATGPDQIYYCKTKMMKYYVFWIRWKVISPISLSLEMARSGSFNPWAMHFVSADVSNDSNSILRTRHSLIASLKVTYQTD